MFNSLFAQSAQNALEASTKSVYSIEMNKNAFILLCLKSEVRRGPVYL